MAVLKRDKYTQQTNKSYIFTDLINNLDVNPDTKDLYRNVNLNAIQQSLKNLIFTDRGERLYQPNVGSDIRKVLFENFTPQTADMLREYIKSTIELNEPRVKYEDSQIDVYEDQNAASISIFFSTIIQPGVTQTLTVLLTRVR
jgi:phage baseplate assembly protein W